MSAEDALAKLEAQVLKSAGVGGWLRGVDTLRKLLAMEEPAVRRIILAMVAPRIEAQALAAILDAFGLGAKDALQIVEDAGIEVISRKGRPSKGAQKLVAGLDKEGRAALAQAVKLARDEAMSDADVLAPIFGHADKVQRRVSDGISQAGNEGSTAIADAAGLPTVWVAEVNACVECLAYSGRVAKVGGAFPGGLTYGKKSYNLNSLPHPPKHPRCRCTVEPLNSQEYADALRREADRSVLRGFSLESESMGTRIDAAKRLLAKGVDAPKSVKAYAKRAIKAGGFATRGRPGR